MKKLNLFVILGFFLFIPLALLALLRTSAARADNRRYDTSDYLSEEPL